MIRFQDNLAPLFPSRSLGASIISFISFFFALAPSGVLAGCAETDGELVDSAACVAALERHLENALDKEVPGIQLGLIHPDWGTVELAAGYANLETEEPMTPAHLCRIASATKLFTAVAAMKLVEDGKLALDATLDELLPAILIPNSELITVELLLRHRAGFADHFNQNETFQNQVLEEPQTVWAPEELVAASLEMGGPNPEDIGGAFGYTNTAYVLLGLIIEAVTSEKYEDFVTREIIEPVGLTDTVFANRIDALEGYAEGYWFDTAKPVPSSSYDASFVWSAGSLVSTATQLAAFTHALFHGRVLNPSTLDEMRDFVEIDGGVRFGLGLLDIPGVGTGHNGAIFGYTSHVAYNPEHDATAAVIVNALSDEIDPLAVLTEILELQKSPCASTGSAR